MRFIPAEIRLGRGLLMATAAPRALDIVLEMPHLITVSISRAIDSEMPLTGCIVCAGVCRALGGDGANWGQFGGRVRQFSVQFRQEVATYGHALF